MNNKEPGYVYILTRSTSGRLHICKNPSFREDWVKIGKSSRPVDVRSKELDNTFVPLSFEKRAQRFLPLLRPWRSCSIRNLWNLYDISKHLMWMQKNCSLVNTKIVMYNNMEWELNCKRFVAFIDIAGFKAMVHNEEATKIATILSEFKLIADKQCEEYGMADMLYTIAVSDSIIIISKDDSEDSFSCFCQSLGVVFNNTLTSKLMTAAVAFGKMYVDRTNMIFFGEPYNIAYSLQEQMNYYGVLCDNSMSDYLKSRELPTHNDNFNFYKRLFMVIPSSLKKKTTSECKYCNEMKEKLNFKWFDMHFDPTHRFVEPDGIYVGTYFQRINSIFEREKLNVVHSKNKTMIEERIKNTEDMIGLFSTRELY